LVAAFCAIDAAEQGEGTMAFIAAFFYRVGVVVFWLCVVSAGCLGWVYLTNQTPQGEMAGVVGAGLFVFGVVVYYIFSAGKSLISGPPIHEFVQRFADPNTPVRMPLVHQRPKPSQAPDTPSLRPQDEITSDR
jgi:hypothetical protein